MELDTETQIIQAQNLYLLGAYEESELRFTSISKNPQNYEVLLAAIISSMQVHKYEQAVDQCIDAILLDKNRYEAYYFQGKAKFFQKQYKSAKIDLENALEKVEKKTFFEREVRIWKNKCEASISNKDLMKEPLIDEQKKKTILEKTEPKVGKTQVLSSSGKISYTWYQSTTKVGIEIYYSIKSEKLVKKKFTLNSIEISFPTASSEEYYLYLDLFADIVPESTVCNIYLDRVEFVLTKKVENQSWSQLERQEIISHQGVQPTKILKAEEKKDLAPSYPTSSKKKKNWDEISREIQIDITNHRDDYCEDQAMRQFQHIFNHADEDTKRAMVKSYQTSGGTVLNMNWKEVKEKDYSGKDRPSPTKGTEYRKLI